MKKYITIYQKKVFFQTETMENLLARAEKDNPRYDIFQIFYSDIEGTFLSGGNYCFVVMKCRLDSIKK